MSKFRYLFEPRSIAVVGVSDDVARPGSQAVRALLKNGYAGRIFPVNPKYPEFEGMKCYASVADIEVTRRTSAASLKGCSEFIKNSFRPRPGRSWAN